MKTPVLRFFPVTAFVVLLLVTLLIISYSKARVLEKQALQDERMFATIVDYYLKTFPESKNATRIVHVTDGSSPGERVHIEVPVAVRAEFLHPYEPAFLAKKSTSKNGLARLIAGELVLLRNEKLFTIPDSGEEIVGDRIIYVVKVEPTR